MWYNIGKKEEVGKLGKMFKEDSTMLSPGYILIIRLLNKNYEVKIVVWGEDSVFTTPLLLIAG